MAAGSDAAAVPDQKTLALVNTYVVSVARMLNDFSSACEDSLSKVQTSLQAAETRLSLLEAQLASAASDTDAQADAGRPVADQASAAPTASPTASAEAALADDGAGAAFEQEQDQHETLPREGWEVVLQQVSQTAQRTTPTLAH